MIGNYYPPSDRMQVLPFHFTGIGHGHTQEEIHRPSGAITPELHYTVSGCGVLEYDGKRELLPPGTMFYLPPGIPHRYYSANDAPWISDWVTWNHRKDESLPSLGTGIAVFVPPPAFRTAERFEAVWDLAVSGSERGRIRACAKLYEMLLELALMLEKEQDLRDDGRRQMRQVLDFIERSFGEKLTLADLCEACGGISEQYLCRLFRMHVGMRPSEYITHRRLEYARSLLVHTDLSVHDVAGQAGFESASYFHRLWKASESLTPLAYRKHCRDRKKA